MTATTPAMATAVTAPGSVATLPSSHARLVHSVMLGSLLGTRKAAAEPGSILISTLTGYTHKAFSFDPLSAGTNP